MNVPDLPEQTTRRALTDDQLVDDWHHWNDYIAMLAKGEMGSRDAFRIRDADEAELDRRGILIPGKRA